MIPTDGRTDLPTDTARCRNKCPRQKRENKKRDVCALNKLVRTEEIRPVKRGEEEEQVEEEAKRVGKNR